MIGTTPGGLRGELAGSSEGVAPGSRDIACNEWYALDQHRTTADVYAGIAFADDARIVAQFPARMRPRGTRSQ